MPPEPPPLPSVPASENPPVSAQSSTQEVLRDVLTKSGDNSKKYLITMLALKLLTGALVLTAILCFIKPSLAASLTLLSQVYFTAVGGVIGVYLGGQSASEWKASAALATTSKKED